MAVYGNVADFYLRFPKETSVNSAAVNDVYLTDASEWLESCLAEKFVVPFSSNNLTALRLTYQKAYHLIRLRTLSPDDADEMGAELETQITALQEGNKAMILSNSSTPIFAAEQDASPEQEAFSTTMDFHPTFGVEEPEDQFVDPDHLRDRRDDKL